MSSRLMPSLEVVPGDLTSNSATALTSVGAIAHTDDGRRFRYVYAGAVALVPGKLQQAAAQVANHLACTVATASAGATSITVTLGATAATANQYANGQVLISAGTGVGYAYKIKSHPAASSGATLVLTLEDPLASATAVADSKADLLVNPFYGVIVNPATATSAPVGGAVTAVSINQYGWIQVGGPGICLNDSGTTVGLGLAPSAAVAGAVKTMAATIPQVGYALETGTDTKYNAILWTMG